MQRVGRRRQQPPAGNRRRFDVRFQVRLQIRRVARFDLRQTHLEGGLLAQLLSVGFRRQAQEGLPQGADRQLRSALAAQGFSQQVQVPRRERVQSHGAAQPIAGLVEIAFARVKIGKLLCRFRVVVVGQSGQIGFGVAEIAAPSLQTGNISVETRGRTGLRL